jgi:hypothetical protein
MTVNDLPKHISILKKNKRVLDIIQKDSRYYAVTNGKVQRTKDIEMLPVSELFNPNSSQADIIEGGYSIVHNKSLSEILGLSSQIIITYNLQNLSALEKSKFSHELLGRGKDSTGLVGNLNGKILGKGSLIIPSNNQNKVVEVMKKWNVKFSTEKVLTRSDRSDAYGVKK